MGKGLRRPFNSSANVALAGYTTAQQVPAEAAWVGYRLMYENHGASTLTIDSAKAAPCPTNGNTGTALSYTTITFGGSGSGVIPAATGSGTTLVPGRLFSDVVLASSVDRSDGGTYPLLHVRTFITAIPTNFAVSSGATGTLYQYRQLTGMEYSVGYLSSDGVTTSPAITMSESNNIIVPAGVEFFYAGAATIGAVGDSLSVGIGSSGNQLGTVQRLAQSASTGGRIWTPQVHGISGQLHSTSYTTFLGVMSSAPPDVMMIWSWSPNPDAATAMTQAAMDACWWRTLDMVSRCRKAGVVPILVTGGAVNAHTAPQNALRLAQNQRVRDLCATGAAVLLDAARVIDPTDSGQIATAYNSDGLHYNDAGYAAIAAAGMAQCGAVFTNR